MSGPHEALRAYEAASATHDLDAAMWLVDEHAVYFFSNETTHVGQFEVRRAIEANFEAIETEEFCLVDVECLVETEDVAVFLFGFRWSGLVGGLPRSGSGRGTSVLRRSDGSWRIVHEHLSKGPFRGN